MAENVLEATRAARGPLGWLHDRKIRTKLLAAVGLAGIAAVVVGLLGLSSLVESSQRNHLLTEQTLKGVLTLEDTRAFMLQSAADDAAAVLYPDASVRKQLNDAVAKDD